MPKFSNEKKIYELEEFQQFEVLDLSKYLNVDNELVISVLLEDNVKVIFSKENFGLLYENDDLFKELEANVENNTLSLVFYSCDASFGGTIVFHYNADEGKGRSMTISFFFKC